MKEVENLFVFYHVSRDGTKTIKKADKNYLPDILQEFQDFLRGCGYYFDGNLDIVNEEQGAEDESQTI